MVDNNKQSLPKSWSELTWQQLCQMWEVKQRYGGNNDVARVAALLALRGCNVYHPRKSSSSNLHPVTGEQLYQLTDVDGRLWTVTAREAAYMANKVLAWFDFPYGDPGEKEQRDKQGNVIKERREPVSGYVSFMRDAMMLPIETLKISFRHFALPGVACNNLTWQQYRSLQTISPQLFAEGITDDQALVLQAKFLANILTPRTIAVLDTSGGSIRLRPHYEYRYNAEQAEGLVSYFERNLKKEIKRAHILRLYAKLTGKNKRNVQCSMSTLFHICFQTYQTALNYYSIAYPLLFTSHDSGDTLRDALTGEVGTVNTVMKYAGYAEQQQVYDSNLPFVLDILNIMTKEAKEIEKMNSKMKRKS